VSGGALSTSLLFDSKGTTDLREQVVVGSVGRRFGDTLSLRVGGGVVTSGRIADLGRHYDLEPGWLTSVTVAREWLGASGHGWFVSTALTIGVAGTRTTREGQSTSLLAQDNRIGAVIGRTVGGVYSPYAVLRAFGGPVYWRRDGERVVGGDLHHYALGAGGSFTIAGSLDVVGELTFVGEKTFTLGVSESFWD
jgi:hypothetical protein